MAIEKGRKHDFRIYKESQIQILEEIEIVADKGYQGINRYHANSRVPYKKPKKGKLTPEQKQENRNHAGIRIKAEHVIRCLMHI